MKTYELVTIFQPELDGERDSLLKNLQDALSREDIAVASSDWWGKKSLAYEIAKKREGLYLFATLTTTNIKISSVLDAMIKTDDTIIRHLLVAKEKEPKKTQNKKAQTKN